MSRAKPKLVVTRRLPMQVEARAAGAYDVVPNLTDEPLDRRSLVTSCAHADALLCCPTDRIDGELIASLPSSLRIVATYSVGTDHIDLPAAARRDIVVTNTPDVLTEATAEIAMLLILATMRGAWNAQATLRAGGWKGWAPTDMPGRELRGARLGLVGIGRIAQATARRALGFGMLVSYWSRREVPLPQDLSPVRRFDDLDDLFRSSDAVSLHIPGSAETAGLVDGRRLALMPPGGVLINTARGTLVDDDALLAALDRGHLRGAGLDVFRGEPDPDPRYLRSSRTYVLPHIGSATVETRIAMGMRALDNLDAHFAGGAAADRVVLS